MTRSRIARHENAKKRNDPIVKTQYSTQPSGTGRYRRCKPQNERASTEDAQVFKRLEPISGFEALLSLASRAEPASNSPLVRKRVWSSFLPAVCRHWRRASSLATSA